jgi:hypothetical protein
MTITIDTPKEATQLDLLKDEIANKMRDLKTQIFQFLEDPGVQPDDLNAAFYRNNLGLGFHLWTYTRPNSEDPEMGEVCRTMSIDEFLDECEQMRSCGEEGWGEDMIEDYQMLISKLEERIAQMRVRIIEEETEA